MIRTTTPAITIAAMAMGIHITASTLATPAIATTLSMATLIAATATTATIISSVMKIASSVQNVI